ncbi:4-carboxymuconolactone decarboxylase [Psychrobacter arcticus 273-4]|uniref:4-carboxymuconolactone decarboxylase n=2 Tax=Psychrobacter arcticus TaxID=334543 RepID=Q4FTQ4_PSYA2|nr:4-carboxymuconolactone decarboxylase [Psychrobacter arcticus 273-4]
MDNKEIEDRNTTHSMSHNPNQNANYDNGLKVRTEVMGAEHVKRSLDSATSFTQPLQDWIIEHAWGSTWQDDSVLPRKYRSLITIGFLIAQKSPNELKGHIRGAINNGASVAEIREVLMHSLPYCGAPATQEAFRAAIEVLNELNINIDK